MSETPNDAEETHYPNDIIAAERDALGTVWTSELGGTRGWLRRRDWIAAAILAERERCATLIERRPGDIPDRQEIARRIRVGAVIRADGTVKEPTNDRP